jgi:hypothetical protein
MLTGRGEVCEKTLISSAWAMGVIIAGEGSRFSLEETVPEAGEELGLAGLCSMVSSQCAFCNHGARSPVDIYLCLS